MFTVNSSFALAQNVRRAFQSFQVSSLNLKLKPQPEAEAQAVFQKTVRLNVETVRSSDSARDHGGNGGVLATGKSTTALQCRSVIELERARFTPEVTQKTLVCT